MNLAELNRATLARQLLLERAKLTPLRALDRLLALQAQWPRPPYVALWSRLAKLDRDDFTRLALDRKLVRATLMRATIHVMSAKDFTALRSAVQVGLDRVVGPYVKRLGGATLADVEAAGRAFFAGKPRTFDALRKAPGATGDVRAHAYTVRLRVPLVQVPTAESAWGWPGSADFALADEWLGEPIAAAPDLAALVLRYLAALGPASVADAQSFLGIPGLRDTFVALRPRLVALTDDKGREIYDLPKAPRPPADTPAPVRFLPEFDNVLLGHADRRRFVADAHRGAIFSKNLLLPGVFLVDGAVSGIWRTERKKSAVALKLSPFVKLDARTRAAVEEEGEAAARFVEPGCDGAVALSWARGLL